MAGLCTQELTAGDARGLAENPLAKAVVGVASQTADNEVSTLDESSSAEEPAPEPEVTFPTPSDTPALSVIGRDREYLSSSSNEARAGSVGGHGVPFPALLGGSSRAAATYTASDAAAAPWRTLGERLAAVLRKAVGEEDEEFDRSEGRVTASSMAVSDRENPWRLMDKRLASVFRNASQQADDDDDDDDCDYDGDDEDDGDDDDDENEKCEKRCYPPAGVPGSMERWSAVGRRVAVVFRDVTEEPEKEGGIDGSCGLRGPFPNSVPAWVCKWSAVSGRVAGVLREVAEASESGDEFDGTATDVLPSPVKRCCAVSGRVAAVFRET